MSKYMHLTVRVTPYYQEEFDRAYPRLARHLGYLDQTLVQSNPTLYALAGQLDKLLYAYDGTRLREVLMGRREKLQALYKNIEKELADWNLAQADKLLYSLEDVFDEIEGELD